IAILLSVFLPKSAEKICKQLGTKIGSFEDIGKEKIKAGQKIGKIKPLFPKLDDKRIEELKKITSKVTKYDELFRKEIDFKEFQKYRITIGKILAIDGNKIKIKIGEEIKEAEIKEKIDSSAIGKKIAVLLEEPIKILLAKRGDKVSLITIDKDIKTGVRVR
ncbi:MAG: hypothetical protein DRN95_04020, partial [Candidatus Hydrothermarchaeota archaeon]